MFTRTALPVAALCTALTALPMSLAAQEATVPQTQPQVGEPVVAATHRDWQILCVQIDEAGTQNCEMYQLLLDPEGSPIAEISIAVLPFGAEFSAGATVTTPLETFLPTGLGFRIGADEEMRIEAFRVCTVVGCIVRMGLSADEVDRMKAGSTASLMIAPFVAIDRPVEITVSLAGFTAAFEDLQTRLSEAAARARAAAGQ